MKKTALIRINLILDMLRSLVVISQPEPAGTLGGTVILVPRKRREENARILIITNRGDLNLETIRNKHNTCDSSPSPADPFYGSNGRPSLKIHQDASLKDPLLLKIHALLDTHMDDPGFGIEQLCRALGMSRAQTYRKFSALNGRTLHDYLRSYRLRKARELLLTTDLNVSEAACVTGFSNLSHFSRIFSEEFGQQPKAYRKKVACSD